jgi:hypothetical protein
VKWIKEEVHILGTDGKKIQGSGASSRSQTLEEKN